MTALQPLEVSTFPLHGLRLIEASAGTGKTHTITNLYVRLLLGRGTKRPLLTREILVLTFTIAATDELRSRIRARVAEASRVFGAFHSATATENDEFLAYLRATSAAPEQDRKLLSFGLLTMDEAAIFTIHGFCSHILREQSFETGQLFNQAPGGLLQEMDQSQLLQRCAEDCFRAELLTLAPHTGAIALQLWPTPGSLVQSIRSVIFRHEVLLQPPEKDVTQALEAWFKDIASCKKAWLEVGASKLVRAAGFKGTTKTVKWLGQLDAYCASDALDIAIWGNWNRATLDKNQAKKTVMPDHPIFASVESIWQRRTLLAQVQFNLWHQVVNSVRARMRLLKTRLNLMNPDDLLKQAYQSLENQNLATRLRISWPVAMVDEFQDTDNLQYGIFKRIYLSAHAAKQPQDSSLIFIGDPKQAIYQFRGADIYTYINAKRQIQDKIFSLDINWRSTAPMVTAVNCLFSRGKPFGAGDDILFARSRAAKINQHRLFTQADSKVPPMQIFTCEQTIAGADKPQRIQDMRQMLVEHSAETCAQLLIASNRYAINNNPVTAGQIAFLVRRHSEAALVQAALLKRHINSVCLSHNSVFQSTTADDLLVVLGAIIAPSNDRLLKQALATRLLQSNLSAIAALDEDMILFQQRTEEFAAYHHRWQNDSFAAMMDQLIQQRHIAHNWLGQPGGERALTNLRHLTELLQAHSLQAPGLHRLLRWFERKRAENTPDESDQLRLESDRHLVQVVTMHAAKGLEYDIVFIPLLDSGTSVKHSKEAVLYHAATQDGFESRLDLAAENSVKVQAETERLAEDMRLLYVALTRAKYQCYVGIPILKAARTTAASTLFAFDIQLPEEERLAPLAELPSTLFRHQRLAVVSQTTVPEQAAVTTLMAPKARPVIADQWRMHSYTGLAAMLSSAQKSALSSATQEADILCTEPGVADDDSTGEDAIAQRTFSRFTFPRGPKTGIALHGLLELLDFTHTENIDVITSRTLLKAGLDVPQWQAVLTKWIAEILSTPLNLYGTLRLDTIARHARLDEMEFHFPVQLGQSFIHLVQSYGYLPGQLHLRDLNGMMSGFIDLIFEFQGQYYVADYKSNDLGNSQANYQRRQMMAAIASHKYDLQYLIYTMALHRYLNHRLAHYDYDRDFGGVYYLFLRGMGGTKNTPEDHQGVFFDRPDKTLVEQMDKLVR